MSAKLKRLTLFLIIIMMLSPSMTEKALAINFPLRKRAEFIFNKENRPKARNHPYGGTLIWGVVNHPTLINPILTQTSVSASLMGLIFDALVKIDAQGKVLPALAESWEISADQKEYVFHLRKNVYFHDGVELTSKDVLFTYQQVMEPSNNSPFRTQYELIARIDVIDRYTFKILLLKPFPSLLRKLLLEIVPEHLLADKNIATADFNYSPVGTGPFRFENWNTKTNNITLTANKNYYDGRPYLDHIAIKNFNDNEHLWSALLRHEVDLVQYLKSDDYEVLHQDSSFKVFSISGQVYYAITYDLKDPIWHDLELRKALACAIDRRALADASTWSGGEEAVGPFHQTSISFNPDVKSLGFDPVESRMMLMHRGWLDVNEDGYGGEPNIRKKNSQPLELRMLVDERNSSYRRIATIIRQQLSEVGIRLKIILYSDEAQLTADFLQKNRPQAWLRLFVGVGYGALDNYDSASNWYSLSSDFGRLWAYKNERVDDLFEKGRSSQNIEQRVKYFREIHKIIYEEQPACFLFFPIFYFAIDSRFGDVQDYFSPHMPTWSIKDWYVAADANSAQKKRKEE